jgi:hypothetical protein
VASLDADIDALLGAAVRGAPVAPPPAKARVARVSARGKGRAGSAVELVAPIVPAPVAPRPYVDPRTLPVRFSRLKLMAQSAAHYRHACQEDRPDSLALRLGSGTHAMLFELPVVCYPGVRNGGKWEAFQAEHEGKAVILNSTEWRKAAAIVAAVRANPEALALISGDDVVRERRIEWQRGSRACASTPDVYSWRRRFVVDLKSTRCAEPGWFAGESFRRCYHGQLAFYEDCLNTTSEGYSEGDIEESYIIAVESAPPHPVTVFRLDRDLIELGRNQARQWFERLLVCEAANQWPEYAAGIIPMSAPDREITMDEFTAAEEA